MGVSPPEASNAARDSDLNVYTVPFDTFFVDVENITFPSSVETTNLKVKDGSNPLISVDSTVYPLCVGFSKSYRTQIEEYVRTGGVLEVVFQMGPGSLNKQTLMLANSVSDVYSAPCIIVLNINVKPIFAPGDGSVSFAPYLNEVTLTGQQTAIGYPLLESLMTTDDFWLYCNMAVKLTSSKFTDSGLTKEAGRVLAPGKFMQLFGNQFKVTFADYVETSVGGKVWNRIKGFFKKVFGFAKKVVPVVRTIIPAVVPGPIGQGAAAVLGKVENVTTAITGIASAV